MPNAFDMDAVVSTAMIPRLKAAKIQATIAYTRLVTLEMFTLLSNAEIDLVLVGEWGTGASIGHYTEANGAADARRAIAEAAPLGVKPPGIFMVNGDLDATDAQIAGPITAYRRGVRSVFDPAGIGVGGYGNGASMAAGLADGTLDKAFVWAGSRTNGTAAFTASNRWSIRQYPTITEFGASVDPDEVQGDYYGFRLSGATVPATPDQPPPTAPTGSAPPLSFAPLSEGASTNDATLVARVQAALFVTVDGVFGPETKAAVIHAQEMYGLEPDGIVGPKTAPFVGLVQ